MNEQKNAALAGIFVFKMGKIAKICKLFTKAQIYMSDPVKRRLMKMLLPRIDSDALEVEEPRESTVSASLEDLNCGGI